MESRTANDLRGATLCLAPKTFLLISKWEPAKIGGGGEDPKIKQAVLSAGHLPVQQVVHELRRKKEERGTQKRFKPDLT